MRSTAPTVSGTVHDSLTGNAGMKGAEVSLLGTTHNTTTNESGEFTFTSVAPGEYTVVAMHPLLDSLGLTIERAISVPAAGAMAAVRLATPSLASFQRARCGRQLEAYEAMKFGAVTIETGAPAAGAAVTVEWVEQVFRDRQSEQRRRSVVATADVDGAYLACGVPRTPTLRTEPGGLTIATGGVRVTARAGAASSADLESVLAEGPFAWHDLTVTASDARVVVRGRVVNSEGVPIAGVTLRRIDAADAAAAFATTDATGRFTLPGVLRRSEQLFVRAVGYAPRSIEFAADEEPYDAGDIELPTLAFELSAVVVTGMRDPGSRAEFDYRRKFGLGTFIDDEDIKQLPRLTSSVAASRVPRSRVWGAGGQERRLMLWRPSFSGDSYCDPHFFIDGQDVGVVESTSEQDSYFGMAVRLEVYRAAHTPARYATFDGCGSVVIWTR